MDTKNLLLCRFSVQKSWRPDYVTLKEAPAGGGVTVSEIRQGGSVPELKVINASNSTVLELEGEDNKKAVTQSRITACFYYGVYGNKINK
jgi:hypothetical protein